MPTIQDLMQGADTIWVIVAAVFVFLMQAGFALLEAGSTRMKNAGHIAGKQILSFAIVSLVFWAVGFAIAFGTGNSFMGTAGWFMQVTEDQANTVFASLKASDVPLGAKYLFEVVFAGVSLAIMWGGLAERAKLVVYFLFGIVFSALIYPVIGHWVWGGGWLTS
ncbi:MAG: ammonium transporter, partial [Bacilli bacterium]|nr:ammonium transporter [Bacilli bacterium]